MIVREPEHDVTFTLTDVLLAVCEVMDISEADIKGHSRKRHPSEARHMAWRLSRKHTKCTLNEIGAFYNRDHTTVIFGINTIEDLMSCYRKTRQRYKRAEGIMLFDAMERRGAQ